MITKEIIAHAEEMLALTKDDDPERFSLAPCPWCRHTAQFDIQYFEQAANSGGTWIWNIGCTNFQCDVCPAGKHVAVRNNQRYDAHTQIKKLRYLQDQWNTNAPFSPVSEILIKEYDMWQQVKTFMSEEVKRLKEELKICCKCDGKAVVIFIDYRHCIKGEKKGYCVNCNPQKDLEVSKLEYFFT